MSDLVTNANDAEVTARQNEYFFRSVNLVCHCSEAQYEFEYALGDIIDTKLNGIELEGQPDTILCEPAFNDELQSSIRQAPPQPDGTNIRVVGYIRSDIVEKVPHWETAFLEFASKQRQDATTIVSFSHEIHEYFSIWNLQQIGRSPVHNTNDYIYNVTNEQVTIKNSCESKERTGIWSHDEKSDEFKADNKGNDEPATEKEKNSVTRPKKGNKGKKQRVSRAKKDGKKGEDALPRRTSDATCNLLERGKLNLQKISLDRETASKRKKTTFIRGTKTHNPRELTFGAHDDESSPSHDTTVPNVYNDEEKKENVIRSDDWNDTDNPNDQVSDIVDNGSSALPSLSAEPENRSNLDAYYSKKKKGVESNRDGRQKKPTVTTSLSKSIDKDGFMVG